MNGAPGYRIRKNPTLRQRRAKGWGNLHQAGLNTLDGASYTYDAAGNRTAKTNYLNSATSNYTYDPIYELTQVTQGGSTTESYSYDAVGNRLSSLGVPNYSYNVSNELTSSSSGSYTYDANGNTLSDASGRSYSWDFENRLTQAVVPGTNGGTTTFKYDPFGRRIEKISPSSTSIFVYDGVNLIQTLNGSGTEVASYMRTRKIDETLAELRGSTMDYYEADGLGSITSLSSSAGALANTYVYGSFGNTTASNGTQRNYFQYSGREFDSESGIYEYRARYYDANAGRFISEDPLKFGAGIDFYVYVKNRPLNLRDPLGLAGVNWSGIWDSGKAVWDTVSDAADKAVAAANCYYCAVTSLANSAQQAQTEAKGPPDLIPGDQEMQGTNYPWAPQFSMCFRQLRISTVGNSNCPECVKAGISTAVGVPLGH